MYKRMYKINGGSVKLMAAVSKSVFKVAGRFGIMQCGEKINKIYKINRILSALKSELGGDVFAVSAENGEIEFYPNGDGTGADCQSDTQHKCTAARGIIDMYLAIERSSNAFDLGPPARITISTERGSYIMQKAASDNGTSFFAAAYSAQPISLCIFLLEETVSELKKIF